MLKSEIKLGKDYAYREKRILFVPFQRVKIIEFIRKSKWKAKWVNTNPGLIDYVDSNQLIVAWAEQRAYLKEEENEQKICAYNIKAGYKSKSPITSALEDVFSSVGEDIQFTNGCLVGQPDAINRLRARAGVKLKNESYYSYVARNGNLHIPFDEAFDLGKNFAALEPSTVLVSIESTEREWAQTASRPGGDYLISLLNEYRAAWAIVRQWTGHDAAIAQREADIQKLERLVWDAIYALQGAKLDDVAARLRRVIDRR